MSVPGWLQQLRRKVVVDRVQGDLRTRGDLLLGVDRDRVFREVIGGGQADFASEWIDPRDSEITLSADDLALLYAWFNLQGHFAELSRAMEMLTHDASRLQEPVLIDLGCGPCTGGLSLAHALGPKERFTYIGIDRASAMHRLGDALVAEARSQDRMRNVEVTWATSLASSIWSTKARGWRPTLVICSYLLASPTVAPEQLVSDLAVLLERIGQGPCVVLYTNSVRRSANRHFAAFDESLQSIGFAKARDEQGSVPHRGKTRHLRYALFVRAERKILRLGGA